MSDAASCVSMLLKLINPLISFFSSDRKRRKERDYLNALSRIDELENRQTKTPRSEQLCKDWYAHINVNLPLWSVRQLRRYPKLDGLDLKHPGANAFVQNYWLFPHDDKTRTIAHCTKRKKRMQDEGVSEIICPGGGINMCLRDSVLAMAAPTPEAFSLVYGFFTGLCRFICLICYFGSTAMATNTPSADVLARILFVATGLPATR